MCGLRVRSLVHLLLLLLHPPPLPLTSFSLPPPCPGPQRFYSHLFCVTIHTSKTCLILWHWLSNKLNLPHPPPYISPVLSCINQNPGTCLDVFVGIQLYYNLSVFYLNGFLLSPSETAVAMEQWGLVFLCVSYDATCRQAHAGIFQCHPRQWEALHGDMSAPCLLVVLMKLGVGRVGSFVQVPGFPSNESASPHSNRLLPWELRLGLPSTVLKYRLISTHTH